MKKILIYIFFQIIFSNEIIIDLITTNDIHGVVNQQTAYFMNPEYPPNIIGGAGFYKYVHDLKKTNSDNLLMLRLILAQQVQNMSLHVYAHCKSLNDTCHLMLTVKVV